jgi:hypothetical protein
VTVPPGLAVTATRKNGAIVTYTASVNDDYSGALTPSCLPKSGSLFPPGRTRVNCIATDAAGNVGTGGFDVSVTFAWGGVLPPIDPLGGSVKLRPPADRASSRRLHRPAGQDFLR